MFSLSSLENHVLASPAVFHLQLLGTMHMLPCFIVMCYPLTMDHELCKDAPMCSLSSDLYIIEPKDHKLVTTKKTTFYEGQTLEISIKNLRKRLFRLSR